MHGILCSQLVQTSKAKVRHGVGGRSKKQGIATIRAGGIILSAWEGNTQRLVYLHVDLPENGR